MVAIVTNYRIIAVKIGTPRSFQGHKETAKVATNLKKSNTITRLLSGFQMTVDEKRKSYHI